ETATVTLEGGCQTVRLPKSIHLPATVFVRQEGESVVLEPVKSKTWPADFFDSVHVTDPTFMRPEQGQLIGPYDLLIAGQALASGLTLVTNNRQEFQRVSGLNLESWM
ncbi:hypothetical protein HY256_08815, partial [Candidatus Sumerlaeota bacterium]|nr:hypothetical protein [Candidatus Sumerlaeota bacterium]